MFKNNCVTESLSLYLAELSPCRVGYYLLSSMPQRCDILPLTLPVSVKKYQYLEKQVQSSTPLQYQITTAFPTKPLQLIYKCIFLKKDLWILFQPPYSSGKSISYKYAMKRMNHDDSLGSMSNKIANYAF